MDTHDKMRILTTFQHWLGTEYNYLPTDSLTMTDRARRFATEHPEIFAKIGGQPDKDTGGLAGEEKTDIITALAIGITSFEETQKIIGGNSDFGGAFINRYKKLIEKLSNKTG